MTLTGALEDYLETIYELTQSQKIVRVRDIARARDVRSVSVTQAMRRLADLKLVKYARREYVELTEQGAEEARRVSAKHEILTRFFREFLAMDADSARQNACAMEHSLTADAMDHLVRFFEYLEVCPDGKEMLSGFHQCPRVHEHLNHCGRHPEHAETSSFKTISVAELKQGEQGTVVRVNGSGAIRQRLLDMGLLPETELTLARIAPAGDPVWIKLGGTQLSLRRTEAAAVMVRTD